MGLMLVFDMLVAQTRQRGALQGPMQRMSEGSTSRQTVHRSSSFLEESLRARVSLLSMFANL